jgi:putative membrane protein insertion efficiency factor
MKRLALGFIRFYQLILSPVMLPSCRFTPTCSQYTYEAISEFGLVKGVWLGVRRLACCHPFHPGGYDPVP